jgi:hypothetical protein
MIRVKNIPDPKLIRKNSDKLKCYIFFIFWFFMLKPNDFFLSRFF